jgi:hypothetical protein
MFVTFLVHFEHSNVNNRQVDPRGTGHGKGEKEAVTRELHLTLFITGN